MANIIKHKRSATPGAAPTAAQLDDGELAINVADAKIFLKKSDNTVVEPTPAEHTHAGFPAASTSFGTGAVSQIQIKDDIATGEAGVFSGTLVIGGYDPSYSTFYYGGESGDPILQIIANTPATTSTTSLQGDLSVTGSVSGTIVPDTSYDLVGGDNISVLADGTTGEITIGVFAAGSTTNVQFNSGGVLAGSNNFTFDGTTAVITGVFVIDSLRLDGNVITPNTTNTGLIINWTGTGNLELGDAAMTVSGQRSVGISLDATARTLAQNNAMAVMGGNVGIGTLVPAERLEVDGNIRLSDTTGNRLQLYRGGGGAYDYTIGKIGNHMAFSTSSDAGTQRYAQFGYHSGATFVPQTVINGYNGNVGIGNTTALQRLHVTGNALLDGNVYTTSGNFAATGDARTGIYNLRNTTTNATSTVLWLDGATTRITIPATSVWQFEVKVVAYNTTDNAAAAWTIRGAIRRDAANVTSLVGAVTVESWIDDGMEAVTATVTADDTNEALQVAVTGLASKTMRWHATVITSEVSFGTP